MLALWPNQLFVLLSLDKVAIRYQAGLTRKVLSEKVVNFSHESDVNLQTVLSQLTQTLSSITLSPNTQLNVFVTSDLVRYTVLPAYANGITRDEKYAYANAIFTETYGGEVEEWLIKCDDSAPVQTTLACAIDKTLFSGISLIEEQFDLNLVRVQPYLIATLNKFNQNIRVVEVIFVVVEINRMILINFKNGGCKKVKSIKVENDWEDVLIETLNREKVYGDQNVNEVLIYAPMQKNITLNALKGWRVTCVKTNLLSTESDSVLKMLEVCV